MSARPSSPTPAPRMCPICQVHGGGPCMQCDHLNRRRKIVPAAAAAAPAKTPRRRPVLAVCPECAAVSPLPEILAVALRGFCECPVCLIGSAPREWTAP